MVLPSKNSQQTYFCNSTLGKFSRYLCIGELWASCLARDAGLFGLELNGLPSLGATLAQSLLGRPARQVIQDIPVVQELK